jgi:hypothetical protein
MPLYTEPDEPEFAELEKRHAWFAAVLLHEYGEQEGAPAEVDTPAALNWLEQIPLTRRYDFEDAECGLAHVSADGAYRCTVWDATGVKDDPWAVFVVDDYGARLLPEYSLLDEEATDEQREAVLRRAADEIPDRAERGEFARTGTPVAVPDWLREPRETDGG